MNKLHFIAKWWKVNNNGGVECTLCPRYCQLGEGEHGFCFVRVNNGGKLISLAYNKPTGFAIDPIEKKPLNHFLPGTDILSFGTAGCNLGCKFCQNWTISKSKNDNYKSITTSPEDVVKIAKRYNAPSIAYTYNDPVVFGEYVVDISKLAREEGIYSVMVTAGYIDKNARKDVFKFIDAANVDLKAFSEDFYSKLTSSHLQPVLDTLIWLKKETSIWVELTTLLIPEENDSMEELKKMVDWVLVNLGDSVPIQFTAFHPSFKLIDKPCTPVAAIKNARKTALSMGIKYCYTGNIHDYAGQATYCPKCNVELIERDWHSVVTIRLEAGRCYNCGEIIDGVFK